MADKTSTGLHVHDPGRNQLRGKPWQTFEVGHLSIWKGIAGVLWMISREWIHVQMGFVKGCQLGVADRSISSVKVHLVLSRAVVKAYLKCTMFLFCYFYYFLFFFNPKLVTRRQTFRRNSAALTCIIFYKCTYNETQGTEESRLTSVCKYFRKCIFNR